MAVPSALPSSTPLRVYEHGDRVPYLAARVLPTERNRAGRQMGEIFWVKLTDPDAELPVVPPDTDVRVLVPAGDAFEDLRNKLSANGIPVREVPYLVESETITGDDGL